MVDFWIANISSKDISLSDLRLTVRAYSSINLLDPKRYSYNLKQLQLSAASGSIFIKRKYIKVRKVPPQKQWEEKNLIAPDLNKDTLISLLEKYKSIEKISYHLGIGSQTVVGFFRKYNVDLPPNHLRPSLIKTQVIVQENKTQELLFEDLMSDEKHALEFISDPEEKESDNKPIK